MCTYLFIKSLRDISNNLDSFVLTFLLTIEANSSETNASRCVPLNFPEAMPCFRTCYFIPPLFHARLGVVKLFLLFLLLFSRPRSFVAPRRPHLQQAPCPALTAESTNTLHSVRVSYFMRCRTLHTAWTLSCLRNRYDDCASFELFYSTRTKS